MAARRGADIAAGVHLAGPNGFVTINGAKWVTVGEINAPHGLPPHVPAGDLMAQGSSFVTINGIPVCIAGHVSACGHPTTGSGHVNCNG